MSDLDKIDIDHTTVDGVDMVKITVGDETLMLTLQEARAVSECIENMANYGSAVDHINAVFDNWGGDDGGTC
jgi:hypothetical protein